jgi:uncharacterized protein (DUF433 family)
MSEAANVVSAFTEEQVERLTGVSTSQLRYWDRTGFFKPSLGSDNRRDSYSRIYTFKDVASLRVLNILRNQYTVPLQHLRKVAHDLAHLSDAKWTSLQLYVQNKKVVLVEPGTADYREIVSKQYVILLSLQAVIADTKRDARKVLSRSIEQIGKFTRARNVSHNRLVIAGTRVPVDSIKRFAEDGFTVDQIMSEYPTLTREDVEAAIKYKGDTLAA